jgi:hypothetical protein
MRHLSSSNLHLNSTALLWILDVYPRVSFSIWLRAFPGLIGERSSEPQSMTRFMGPPALRVRTYQ